MSQNKKKSNDQGDEIKSWGHLRDASSSPTPQGPTKPWAEDLDAAATDFIDFLQNSDSKKAVKDFIIDAYKKFEAERVAQIKARVEIETQGKPHPSNPQIKAGNIGPLMYSELNMAETEQAVARSLRATKASLVRSIEDRVEDINRLLSDIGGFSAQLKSSFARSTVVFLEQEDPKYSFRERLIFSINLPNYELRRPWDHSEPRGKKSGRSRTSRSSFQMTWDEAVNSLSRIVETTGLKPKYCKNDRHYGRFIMKQELRSTDHIPDEYFSFTLDYNTAEKIDEMKAPYAKVLNNYESKIKKLENKLKSYPSHANSARYLELKKKHLYLCQDRDFFVGTTPDPNQLDEGLLFLIEVSTLKDYHIVKDRMQSIMTRYILYLSRIAAEEASNDTDVEYDLAKAKEMRKSGKTEDEPEFISPEEMENVPQYVVDTNFLKMMSGSGQNPLPKPVKARSPRRKKAA